MALEDEDLELSPVDDRAMESEDDDDDGADPQKADDDAGMDDSGRLRLRADVSLDEGNYAGKRSSRKMAFDSEEEELEPEDADASKLLRERLLADGSLDEDREASVAEKLSGARDDELEALTREYEQLREEEEKAPAILRGQEEDDRRKGQAVRNQRALWDRCLDFRISMQKTLTAANRLPRERARVAYCSENDQIGVAYAQLTDSAVRALDSLVDLETALLQNNSDITERYSKAPNDNGKRGALEDVDRAAATSSERAWEKVDEMYSKLISYRDNALNRWQTKTQIYTGAVAKVKFRAFNQSLSQQVASTMRDSSRLIGRTKLKIDDVNVLGQPAEKIPTGSRAVVEEEDGLRGLGTDPMEGLDRDSYDDSDFYQQLLREFLESSDPSALTGMYATARQHSKKRKQVDRRASKGRKIRYNVFEPLVNFMAPKPFEDHPMAAQVFGNLFGVKSGAPNSAA